MPGRRDRSPLETQATRRLASGSVLALAISLGVITGFGELVQLGLDRRAVRRVQA